AMWPTSRLLAQAARAQALPGGGLPGDPANPLTHFVVLCMENRSFDHYFGWYSDKADAVQSRTYLDPDNGDQPVATRPAATLAPTQFHGCGHPDPDHSWGGGRDQLGSSRDNPAVEPAGFLAGSNDEFALTYYEEDELG